MQEAFQALLPNIIDILHRVNSQMLLILKSNDLLRGIEYCLGTQDRMNSFKTMSKCCIRSVYRQQIENAISKLDKFKFTIGQYWALIKFTIYYTLLQYQIVRTICRL